MYAKVGPFHVSGTCAHTRGLAQNLCGAGGDFRQQVLTLQFLADASGIKMTGTIQFNGSLAIDFAGMGRRSSVRAFLPEEVNVSRVSLSSSSPHRKRAPGLCWKPGLGVERAGPGSFKGKKTRADPFGSHDSTSEETRPGSRRPRVRGYCASPVWRLTGQSYARGSSEL